MSDHDEELDALADEATNQNHTPVDDLTPMQVQLLTRKELLSFVETQYEVVDLSEEMKRPGASIRVRSLTATERDAFESSLITGKGRHTRTDTRNLRAKLVALTAVNDDNSRMFTMKDVDSLGRVNAAVVDKVYGVAARLSGITEKDVEELAGNFESDQLGGM